MSDLLEIVGLVFLVAALGSLSVAVGGWYGASIFAAGAAVISLGVAYMLDRNE